MKIAVRPAGPEDFRPFHERYFQSSMAAGTLQLPLDTSMNSPIRWVAAWLEIGPHNEWQGRDIGSAHMQAALGLKENGLGLTRMELEDFSNNDTAVHLNMKYGFEIDGTRPMFALRAGKHVDVYVMGRGRPSGPGIPD